MCVAALTRDSVQQVIFKRSGLFLKKLLRCISRKVKNVVDYQQEVDKGKLRTPANF